MAEQNNRQVTSPIGKLYNTREIAGFLLVNVRCVQRWIKHGQLKAFWVGGGYRISEEDLKRFIDSRKGFRSKRGPR